ncbi:hypothetical protein [Clostridium sp. YIM B02551]|nr:hypothetical protein [Clostridium sp. YIM B02551]
MNPVMIVKIIILLLELIARGMDADTAISNISSKFNVSSMFLRKFI